MKKIYVMAAFLGATSFAFNQVQKTPAKIDLERVSKAVPSTNYSEKAAGTVIWSSDFSDPTTDWTIQSPGNQGTWEFGAISDLPNYSFVVPIASQTPSNGIAFFAGIEFLVSGGGPVDTQNSWIEMASSVDLSTEQSVIFEFYQAYNAFNTDQTLVEVSLDGGTTWVQSIDINPNVAVNTDADVFFIQKKFNVNNSSTVKFRFRWLNESADPNFGSGYVWQIDDVKITTFPDNDISTEGLYFGSEGVAYYQIPVEQIAPIDFSITAVNEGLNLQKNVVLKATEASEGYVGTSTPLDIIVGGNDSLAVNTPFTPSGAGNYAVNFEIENDSIDDNSLNNIIKTYKFNVGGELYARDTSKTAENGTVYNDLPTYGLASGDLITKYAVAYDIYQDAEITAVDFQFGNKITNGGQVVAAVYEADLETLVEETEFYDMQLGDEGAYKTLKFDNPPTLVQGNTYYVQVQIFSDSASIASAGVAPLGTSIFYAGTSWGNLAPTNPTYVIRMNFDPLVSIENNEISNLNVSQNFPNPFANETTVVFNLKEAANVSYSVVDLTGKVVANVNEGNTMAGEHEITIDGTSFANGVYYLNINAGDSKVTRKMIVNK